MKKSIFIIITLFLLFTLYGCPPTEPPGINLIFNNHFDDKVSINTIATYQEDNDVLVVEIEQTDHYLRNFYISGNSIDILDAKAFGYNLDKTVIEEKEYFFVDLEDLETIDCDSFLLELTFAKNSIYRGIYYEEILKRDIVAHSFDIYINYDEEESDGNLQNYRFFLDGDSGEKYDINRKIVVYNNLEDLLNYNGYYHKLFLPFSEGNVIDFSKEMIYYPNDNRRLFLKTNYFILKVWVNNRGIIYENQEKIIYEKNGNSFTIIVHDNAHSDNFSIDFAIEETENIQYSYMIENTNIEEVKDFIDSLQEYTIEE